MEIESSQLNEIKMYLKALLILKMNDNFSTDKKELNKGAVARFLHSIGFQPSEIAPLLGKKKATEISPYLYAKKK
ncbi:MAG: hypothetical protein QY331_06360 [Melioribacteraceae bacterium]|nr:MAG: hypothetical protein QY331_06360 [Melioribacteraceae bacterium]